VYIFQVGVDLIGPLPKTKRGNKYVITLVHYFSKWPEAEPLPDKTAIGVALFLYNLFCRLVANCFSMLHIQWLNLYVRVGWRLSSMTKDENLLTMSKSTSHN